MSEILNAIGAFTVIPNNFLDRITRQLSAVELRVMLYVYRHTLGYKKRSDAISYDQFIHGVRARDGRIVDEGTGVSRRALIAALRALEDKGLIKREHTNGTHAPAIYTVIFNPQLGDNQQEQVQDAALVEFIQVQEDHPTKENHESKEHDHAVEVLLEIPDMTIPNAKRLADIALRQHKRDMAFVKEVVKEAMSNTRVRVPAAYATTLIQENSAGYSKVQQSTANHIGGVRKKVRGGPDLTKWAKALASSTNFVYSD